MMRVLVTGSRQEWQRHVAASPELQNRMLAQHFLGERVLRRAFPAETPPEALGAAVREVLADPGYRVRTRAMQRRTVALPSHDRLVADVGRLVAGVQVR